MIYFMIWCFLFIFYVYFLFFWLDKYIEVMEIDVEKEVVKIEAVVFCFMVFCYFVEIECFVVYWVVYYI